MTTVLREKMRRLPSTNGPVTIQAVASRAGVSAMTVSNVMNRTGRASEATRARVLSAVSELGYVPNEAARRLAGSALARIGLVYSGVESVFIDATLAAVALVAAAKGLQLQIRSPDGATPEATATTARELVRSGAQALLLLPPFAEMLGREDGPAIAVPMAAIATDVALPRLATVRIDNRAASRLLTDRLLAAGRTRVAVLAGPSRHSDGIARLSGYRDALSARGVPFDPALHVEGDFSFASGLTAAAWLLDLSPPPDAVVAANDDMAAAAIWMAHSRGVRVPADLAVVGFDDTLIATRVWPPITTVRQPVGEMAAHAVDCLVRAVQRPDPHAAPEDVLLPFELIKRASG